MIREQGFEKERLKEVKEFPCKRRCCKEGKEVKVERLKFLPESEAPVRFTVVISPEVEQETPCQKQGEVESDQFERKFFGSEIMVLCLKLFNNFDASKVEELEETKVVFVVDVVKVIVKNETKTLRRRRRKPLLLVGAENLHDIFVVAVL